MPERHKIVERTEPLRRFSLAAGILVICFAYPLWELVRFAMASAMYSYILLVPLISAWLIWRKRRSLPISTDPSRVKAGLFLAGGVLTLILAWCGWHYKWTPLNHENLIFMMVAFVLCLFGLCHWFQGKAMMRAIAFPVGFLIFLVPLPDAALRVIDSGLQAGSAQIAAGLFWVSGTPCLRDGLIFQLPGIRLLIGPECSGIHSTLVLFIASLLAGHLFLRSPWRRFVLACFVIPLGMLRNGFRVFVIGQLCVHVGPQMINSYIHRKGGPIFFALALIPFFAFLWMLYQSETRRRKAGIQSGEVAHD